MVPAPFLVTEIVIFDRGFVLAFKVADVVRKNDGRWNSVADDVHGQQFVIFFSEEEMQPRRLARSSGKQDLFPLLQEPEDVPEAGSGSALRVFGCSQPGQLFLRADDDVVYSLEIVVIGCGANVSSLFQHP